MVSLRNVFILLLFSVLFITGCNPPEPEVIVNHTQETMIEVSQDANKQPVVIAQNLNIPWSIDKINDTFYLSERPGSITKIEDGQAVRQQG